jgi:hypothetical protein
MNIITEIRDYINGKVKQVDSDLDFDGFVFGDEKIGLNPSDSTYKLVIGNSTPTRLDSSYSAEIDSEVWIYKAAQLNDRVDDFDNTYCKALDIASSIINQETISQDMFIKSISNSALIPEPVDGVDNVYRFRIQFTVTVYYKLEL